MDFISNKAITIGVGLLVTIAIVSGVIFSITQVINIYSKVYNTDTSIKGKFDEFDKFDNGEFTMLDIYNTIRKYYGNSYPQDNESKYTNPGRTVYIAFGGHNYISQSQFDTYLRNLSSTLSEKYTSTLDRDDSDGTVTITFTKKREEE